MLLVNLSVSVLYISVPFTITYIVWLLLLVSSFVTQYILSSASSWEFKLIPDISPDKLKPDIAFSSPVVLFMYSILFIYKFSISGVLKYITTEPVPMFFNVTVYSISSFASNILPSLLLLMVVSIVTGSCISIWSEISIVLSVL